MFPFHKYKHFSSLEPEIALAILAENEFNTDQYKQTIQQDKCWYSLRRWSNIKPTLVQCPVFPAWVLCT